MKPNKLPKLSPQAQPVTFLRGNRGANLSHDPGDLLPPAHWAVGWVWAGMPRATPLSWDRVHWPQAPTHALASPTFSPPCRPFPPFQVTAFTSIVPAAGWPPLVLGVQLQPLFPWDAFPGCAAPTPGSWLNSGAHSIFGFVLGLSIPWSGCRRGDPPGTWLHSCFLTAMVYGSRILAPPPLRAPWQPQSLLQQVQRGGGSGTKGSGEGLGMEHHLLGLCWVSCPLSPPAHPQSHHFSPILLLRLPPIHPECLQ